MGESVETGKVNRAKRFNGVKRAANYWYLWQKGNTLTKVEA